MINYTLHFGNMVNRERDKQNKPQAKRSDDERLKLVYVPL